MSDLKQLYDAILSGDEPTAKSVVQQAVDQGVDAQELVNRYMVPAMDEVGRRFEANEYYVPEVLIAARAMKSALAVVGPRLVGEGAEPSGTVVIGTVAGDLHDIGKNLVASMLEGSGYKIIDLGVDVKVDRFVDAVKQGQPDIVAMSALLTTTMPVMKAVIDELGSQGLRDKVVVMVGGAPMTQQYADEIGADGYSDNAAGAVRKARQLTGS